MRNYDMSLIQQSKCPACHSESETIGEVEVEVAAQHFKSQESTPKEYLKLKSHIENLWQTKSCKRNRCLNCKLVFSTPFIAGDAFFYNLAHPSHVYPKNRWEYDCAISEIQSMLDEEFSLLEIGAGNGEFLRRIMDFGVSVNRLLAIEYDDLGSKSIKSLGIDCLKVDIRKSEIARDKKFKVVAMFQVFEHLDALDTFLVSVRNILWDHGLVIVSVPNGHHTEFIEKILGFIDMPPNHLTTWNYESLKFLFARHNFKLKHFQIEKASFFSFAYQLIYYSILTRRQFGTQIEKKLLGIKKRGIRIFFFALFAMPHFVLRFRAMIKFNPSLGGSQFAIFEKG